MSNRLIKNIAPIMLSVVFASSCYSNKIETNFEICPMSDMKYLLKDLGYEISPIIITITDIKERADTMGATIQMDTFSAGNDCVKIQQDKYDKIVTVHPEYDFKHGIKRHYHFGLSDTGEVMAIEIETSRI